LFHNKLDAAEEVLLTFLEAKGEDAEALRDYAALLQRRGRNDEAAAVRRRMHAAEVAALGLTGPHAEATVSFRCAAEGIGPAPDAAPAGYVASHYDAYADTFDDHLLGTLAYATPGLIAAALDAAGALASRPSALDLGCGTGLMGAALAGKVGRLVGCDLSAGMVEKARARGVYDELAVGDILSFLGGATERFGLVTCADVFPYIGDLSGVTRAIAGVMDAGGWFAFSAERGEGDDFRLSTSGRYNHSESYLRRLADEAGWSVVSHEERELRRQHGDPVMGHVMLWRLTSR
jgi:predicted TPR repeat methyltransferase